MFYGGIHLGSVKITIKILLRNKYLTIFLFCLKTNNYWPQRSCGQGNIFTPVCHSVHGGGGSSASVQAGIPPPPGADTPLGPGTPWEQTPPWVDTSPPGPGTPQEQTPLGADTPREADSGIRSMSGRYASCWNAFLFYFNLCRKWRITKMKVLWCTIPFRDKHRSVKALVVNSRKVSQKFYVGQSIINLTQRQQDNLFLAD